MAEHEGPTNRQLTELRDRGEITTDMAVGLLHEVFRERIGRVASLGACDAAIEASICMTPIENRLRLEALGVISFSENISQEVVAERARKGGQFTPFELTDFGHQVFVACGS